MTQARVGVLRRGNLLRLTTTTTALLTAYLVVTGALGRGTLGGVADVPRFGAALSGLIFLVAAGVLLRFVRWHLYSRRLGWPLPVGHSFILFIAGFAFSATPGKAGEFVKCALVRDAFGIPMAESAGVLLLERLGDLIAVMLLSLGVLFVIPEGRWFVALGATASACALALILGAGAWARAADRGAGSGILGTIAAKVGTLLDACRVLLTLGLSLRALALALTAWGCEAVGFETLAVAFIPDHSPSLAQAFSIFSLATLAGAFSFLPGGLGSFEAVMALGLAQTGASAAEIVSVVAVFRLCSLWLATIVGLAFLLIWTVVRRGAKSALAGSSRTATARPPMKEFTGATVILPLLTETRSLRDTVDIILRDCRCHVDRFLIVVCERTRPESLAVASELQRQHGGLVQVHPQRRPFLGGAMRDAFDLVESSHAIMMASDLETDPNQVQALIAAARVNPAAIVTASRWIPGAGFHGYGRAKRLANMVFQRAFGLLYRTNLTDLTYGYRLFPTDLIQSIAWEELRHAFLFETLVKPLRLGISVIEIPSVWRARIEGESQNRVRDHLDYLRIGLKVRFRSPSALVKPQTARLWAVPMSSPVSGP